MQTQSSEKEKKMSLEIGLWIYSFRAQTRCLGGRVVWSWYNSPRGNIADSFTLSAGELFKSALACRHVTVARAANSCDCRMIKQFIMMQPTISKGRPTIGELWNMKDALEGYFELYNRLHERMPCCPFVICLHFYAQRVFFCKLFRASARVRLKVALSFKTKNWHKHCRPEPAAIIKLSALRRVERRHASPGQIRVLRQHLSPPLKSLIKKPGSFSPQSQATSFQRDSSASFGPRDHGKGP